MKIFTKLFLVATLAGSHLLSLTAFAVGAAQEHAGVSPVNKGTAAVWKLMGDNRSGVLVSAQNARPAFILNEEEHTCSKIYESAVSASFHPVSTSRTPKSMYTNITLAAFTAGAVAEVKPLPSINAYPNPARGYTKLAISQPFSYGNFKVRISNTIGRVIGTYELPSTEQKVLELDLKGLPAGVYFYSLLVDDKTVETKRLILQK